MPLSCHFIYIKKSIANNKNKYLKINMFWKIETNFLYELVQDTHTKIIYAGKQILGENTKHWKLKPWTISIGETSPERTQPLQNVDKELHSRKEMSKNSGQRCLVLWEKLLVFHVPTNPRQESALQATFDNISCVNC